MVRKTPACGNPDCAVSTHIFDELTFGHGELDMNGFWEHGCAICAREWESRHPGESAWPYDNRIDWEETKIVKA